MTGGNIAGIDADANNTSIIKSRAFGLPLAAIAPMFQITGRA